MKTNKEYRKYITCKGDFVNNQLKTNIYYDSDLQLDIITHRYILEVIENFNNIPQSSIILKLNCNNYLQASMTYEEYIFGLQKLNNILINNNKDIYL